MSSQKDQLDQCATTYVFPAPDPLAETESPMQATGEGPSVTGAFDSKSQSANPFSPTMRKLPLQKTSSVGPGTSAFGSDGEQNLHRQLNLQNSPAISLSNDQIHKQPQKCTNCGTGSSSGSAAAPAPLSSAINSFSVTQTHAKPARSAMRGHSRSASHGGVSIPGRISEGLNFVSGDGGGEVRKGHTRAASHGQIVDQPYLGRHQRTSSKTEFILPPGHVERDRQSVSSAPRDSAHSKGHSRQASRSESIYTISRPTKSSIKSKCCFWRKRPIDNPKIRIVVPNHKVPPNTPDEQHPNGIYPNNHIRTTKYTAISFLPKNLFEQFHRVANLYFISIVLLNWIPIINAFGKEIAMFPVVFVLGVTCIKDLFEDRRRYNSDKRINNSLCRVWKSDAKGFEKIKWKEIRVGDVVHLSCNDRIPADILVLRTSDHENGLCYIETTNLDGESNLKRREVIRGFANRDTFQSHEFDCRIEVKAPTTKIYQFEGTVICNDQTRVPVTVENLLLRDCILKNTDYVEGIVVYAGRETKTMLNNKGSRHKRTGLERMMNLEVLWCVVILAVLCIVGATGSGLWLSSSPDVPFAIPLPGSSVNSENFFLEACYSFLTFIIILQVMIPLSLYVTIELTKLMQIFHIQNDIHLYDPETNKRIECRATNIPEDLGQIQYVFSDKTGTLTENKMLFRRCTIGGDDFDHSQSDSIEQVANDRLPAAPTLIVNNSLNELLEQLGKHLSKETGTLSTQEQRIMDFFLIMAVCNTVVIAKHPHHDKMNTNELLAEPSTSALHSRLSPIRETVVDGTPQNSIYQTQDHCQLLIELQQDSEESGDKLKGTAGRPAVHPITVTGSTPQKVTQHKRPRVLDILPSSLSPISSSNETTPTESPAQRPRLLQLPNIRARFNRSPNASQSVSTPTPSPSDFKPIFEAESPDELALVQAAYAYNCKLLKRTPSLVKLAITHEYFIEYEILHTFPFDSARKRMSIVLKNPKTREIILFCKGADSAIFSRLKHTGNVVEQEMRNQTMTQLNNYAREGLRTLVLAKRILTEQEYNAWLIEHNQAMNDLHNRERRVVETYTNLENNLEIVGATGIEDRLQEGVPETIESLRKAGIVVWVLTGDKQETAINIAYSCKLFSPAMDIIKLNARSKDAAEKTISFYLEQAEKMKSFGVSSSTGGSSQANTSTSANVSSQQGSQQNNIHSSVSSATGVLEPLCSKERALVVDGKNLTYILDQKTNLLTKFLTLTKHCSAVLCCRSTPLQKGYIVSGVKDQLCMRTLAIGDGANDVSMIQRADVGIGISGKEGMQAVMASDFAISKFKYLERLLLVHGHWCYDRLARMILYFFYKNAAFVFVIFWYQLLNGWSGSVMIDQMYLMVFNLFFTALPPMAIGIYDQDAPAELLLAVPRLYRQGRLQKVHQAHSFWLNMLDSLYQSVVIFFMSYGAYSGSDVGMFEFGTTVVVACMFTMLVHMAIEAKSWTMIHVLSIVISIVFFYAFAFVYNSVCINCLGFENPFWVIHELIASPIHWLIVAVTTVLAVLPRLVIRCMEASLFPSDVTKALLMKRQANRQDEELFVSWSRSTSTSSVFKERMSCLCFPKRNTGLPEAINRTVPPISTVTT